MKHARIIAIPVIVLAALGLALAMWSETLMVNVTVETGEVDVKFSGWACSDIGPDPQAEGFYNSEGKNVAWCSVVEGEKDDEGDLIELVVTIGNAYPGYTVEVYLYIDNIGTIPVKLYDYELTFEEPIEYELSIPEDTQLHPGETATYILKITIPQEADECAEYTGKVTLVFAQWNEVQP